MMNILISNDDGFASEGIFTLANALLELGHKVTVVAPSGNRSGFSHSLNFGKEIYFKKENLSDKFSCFSLSGTPADCVKFAMHYFEDKKFDLVCSGINQGSNLGSDTLYSGTVAIGLEANFFSVPSIAFSLVANENFKWETCFSVIKNSFDKLVNYCSKDCTLNVNIPNVGKNQITGMKFCKLGKHIYTDRYVLQQNGSYVLVGEPIHLNQEECDVNLIKENCITVTPIAFDRTNHQLLNKIKGKNLL